MPKQFISIVKGGIPDCRGAVVMVSLSNHVRRRLLPSLLAPDIIKYLIVLGALSFILSCKKEHLQPVSLPGDPEPLVYISAKLDGDSVYFAGGVNGYTGSPFVFDTGNNRTFNFNLKMQLSNPKKVI